MIWRLPRPIRGLVAGLLVFVALPVLTALAGSAMGSVELLLVLLLSIGTGVYVGTRSPAAKTR